jgi:TDG/mug DNA glycosylase family protein
MAHLIDWQGESTLADILAPGLVLLIVGYNPNPLAVAKQHYYARTANRFWEDLHEAGLLPGVLRGPQEDLRLGEFGIGLTDLIKRPTTNIDGLTTMDFRQGAARLDGIIRDYRPAMVCFNGLGLLPLYLRWGSLPDGVQVRAVPSTSPRNNGRRAERLAAWIAIREELQALGVWPATPAPRST